MGGKKKGKFSFIQPIKWTCEKVSFFVNHQRQENIVAQVSQFGKNMTSVVVLRG